MVDDSGYLLHVYGENGSAYPGTATGPRENLTMNINIVQNVAKWQLQLIAFSLH